VDLHENIFYAYRGPASEGDRETQLENNLKP